MRTMCFKGQKGPDGTNYQNNFPALPHSDPVAHWPAD